MQPKSLYDSQSERDKQSEANNHKQDLTRIMTMNIIMMVLEIQS